MQLDLDEKNAFLFLCFAICFFIGASILLLVCIESDEQRNKMLFVEKNIEIIKNQYVTNNENNNGNIKSVQLIEKNNKFDGYFMNIDKKYSILRNKNNEIVILGVSGKLKEIKNTDEHKRIKRDLCPYMFYYLKKYDVILSGVLLSENIDDIVILKNDKDYCDLIEKENKFYLILDSNLILE